MSNTRKLIVLVFTVMMVISLQLNTTLINDVTDIFTSKVHAEKKSYCSFMGLCLGGPNYCGFNSGGKPCYTERDV